MADRQRCDQTPRDNSKGVEDYRAEVVGEVEQSWFEYEKDNVDEGKAVGSLGGHVAQAAKGAAPSSLTWGAVDSEVATPDWITMAKTGAIIITARDAQQNAKA